MGNVKVVMSPGSARKKKGIGCDIRVERKNKFESLVNGGGRDRDLLLRPLCGKKSDGANHLHYVSILPTGTYGQFRDRPGRYKRRDKKHKDKLPWSLCVDIISSPNFFLVCTENGSAPEIFGHCIWIAIALPGHVMCRPRSQSPRHQDMISTMLSR